MFIFYKELTLEEGFTLLGGPRNTRVIDGAKFSAPSGIALWQHCIETNSPLKCWHCRVEADRFILKLHRNDQNKPAVLDLYAHTGRSLVMMTRDHIIPASMGGVNHVDNLRPGCETCNNKRKSTMNQQDTEFMDRNPHLRISK